MPADLLLLDRGDGKIGLGEDRRHRGFRPLLVVEVELFETLAVEMCEPRGEGLTVGCPELDLDAPELPGLEDLDLRLPLADKAERDRLHAARRPAPWELPPQHRREREAHEVVERPA